MSSPLDHGRAPDLPGTMVPLGPIVRLQVQVSSLKRGERPHRWYDPAPIRPVPALRLDGGGVTGLDGGEVADVHHRDHPESKFRGENGLSIGFTGHYAHIRERFGDHLTNGIAGENILIEAPSVHPESAFTGGIVIATADGPVILRDVQAAPPCVEFSKFCAGYPVERQADRVITETLQFLHQGMRGFYATIGNGPATIALGNMAWAIAP